MCRDNILYSKYRLANADWGVVGCLVSWGYVWYPPNFILAEQPIALAVILWRESSNVRWKLPNTELFYLPVHSPNHLCRESQKGSLSIIQSLLQMFILCHFTWRPDIWIGMGPIMPWWAPGYPGNQPNILYCCLPFPYWAHSSTQNICLQRPLGVCTWWRIRHIYPIWGHILWIGALYQPTCCFGGKQMPMGSPI